MFQFSQNLYDSVTLHLTDTHTTYITDHAPHTPHTYLFVGLSCNESPPVGDHLDEHLQSCFQHQWTAVWDVLQNELGKHTGHIVTPGGEIGDDVLKRVEGGPVEDGRGKEGQSEGEREGDREGGMQKGRNE